MKTRPETLDRRRDFGHMWSLLSFRLVATVTWACVNGSNADPRTKTASKTSALTAYNVLIMGYIPKRACEKSFYGVAFWSW